ncbi:MAG: multidrug DMT transporter permease [Actinobacteria bacterium BACL15 MAG-120619-bin91]|jgi:drug/metabolite transporter (DMT)-like permease|uniref:Multidrug DMT transporter permease n=2 Tax=ac1 cluster TaxID=1655545 RepID=A0A0R2PKD3_9ACTN|nr:MAG: multidrug DMT transporter permease [Actinobacteria bacterium BACL15 MAG-120619-bin91]KRO38537.1 MAG: multidrug DMT transporter permease [Actinobacteria bacterium BACL15 MAG-120823-bin78]
MNSGERINEHTAMPAKPDLIRLGVGIIGIGTSGPLIAMSAMPVLTLIFWRNLGGALLTLPFALRHSRDRIGVKWAVIAGVLLALHFIGFFLAMRMTTVAAGTALVALQPIFAALFVKFSGGHIPSTAWLGMIVSFVGVIMVSGVDLTISFRSFVGDIAAIISAALAAAYMMAGSRAQRSLETSTYTTIAYFTCSLTAFPMALLLGNEIFIFSRNEWLILIGLILGAQMLGHTMFNSALKRVSPAIVSLIVFFEVPVSAVLAAWWLDQRPPLGIIPGIVLILMGCILVVTRTREPKRD